MSKFRIWVDDSNLDKVMGFNQFDEDAQRKVGFTGGTPASSIRVNTALRQANLIACALMDIVDTENTTDFRSPVSTVKDLINNYISNTMVAYKATNADVTNLNTDSNAIVNFKIGNGTVYNKTINNVVNASNATNVNVTNKNTGDNAVINFQLGNGTEFSKTVNNVANARKVDNGVYTTNFNNTNQTKFGDYIVPKKKLLYSNSTGLNLNFTSNGQTVEVYRDSSPIANRIFEISFSNLVSTYTRQFVKIRFSKASSGALIPISFGTSSGTLSYVLWGEFKNYPDNNTIYIEAHYQGSVHERNMLIFEIYEIFE
mgnify:CR=1 FL=1